MATRSRALTGEEKQLADLLVKEELISREDLAKARDEEAKKGIPWVKTLLYKEIVMPKQITDILRTGKPKKAKRGQLGEVLLDMGALTAKQLDKALVEQEKTGRYLGRILLDQDVITPKVYTQALCRLHDLPFVDIAKAKLQPKAVDLLPENVVRDNLLIPFRAEDGELHVALGDPSCMNHIDMVGAFLRDMEIIPYLAVEADVQRAIEKYFPEDAPKAPAKKKAAKKADVRLSVQQQMDAQARADATRFEELNRAAENVPVVKLVATIIEGAINSRATDIHLDPQEPEMRVRYRIDGVLHDVMTIPKAIETAVMSRLKILADMDITETRRPQDGHISFDLEDETMDIRVASLPTHLGERLVLRLLDPTSVMTGMNELGMSDRDLNLFNSMLTEPYGMILLVGPTGSGKTTTLYAALNTLNVLTDSIVTLEDPVEYRLAGINQVQIDADIEVTFANTLRAILRQDPDKILVGEIRDKETAEIAINAAMTGHLLFSTLHANTAPEAVTRLNNMGIERFLIAAALLGSISQRLVRIICEDCKETYKPTKALLKSIGLPESTRTLYSGGGCDSCYHTGFRGRSGAFEVMQVEDKIRKLIEDGASADVIAKAAKMQSIAQDARQKVKAGITTVEEYFKVAGAG